MSAKKKYITIIFILLIHKVCQILFAFTSQCHCLRIHRQCFYLPHIPIFFTGIPQHTSSAPSIALDIQHFLQPFIVTSVEIHIDQIIDLYFMVYKLT